jgi:hypothetical protein
MVIIVQSLYSICIELADDEFGWISGKCAQQVRISFDTPAGCYRMSCTMNLAKAVIPAFDQEVNLKLIQLTGSDIKGTLRGYTQRAFLFNYSGGIEK